PDLGQNWARHWPSSGSFAAFNGPRFGHHWASYWTSFGRSMDSESHNTTKKPFHQAARDYDNTPNLFRRLMPFKDGIAELRQKRASFATIAEFLTDEGVIVSRQTVARFCRKFLASALRSKGRKESAEPI